MVHSHTQTHIQALTLNGRIQKCLVSITSIIALDNDSFAGCVFV